jgi:hypothetical protein
VSLARFYARIADAVGPLLGSSRDLEPYLAKTAVCLEAPPELQDHPSHQAGFMLAVNLCARLYPRLRFLATKQITDDCTSLALRINPTCEIQTGASDDCDAALVWGCPSSARMPINVAPAAWDICLDQPEAETIRPTNTLTSLAAGAVGVGELFRTVFSAFLRSGRVRRSPGFLNLLTLDESRRELPDLASKIQLGRIHLAGAGAIGQAAIHALSFLHVSGTIVIVDPESLALSNLQRYVLAFDQDVGTSKCSLAARALESSGAAVDCVEARWGEDARTIQGVETVCAALDTAEARIAVQAGLPRTLYNAWTQPSDIGWSRHESFGQEPCLACLYVPSGPKLNQHQLIARALRQQDLRVLAYLTVRAPVDVPLRPEQIPRLPNNPVPLDASTWVEHSILEDIGRDLRIEVDELSAWNGKQISDLYREGICGGAIISDATGELPHEVAVPLAHQSALAGIMLAAELVFSVSPELRPFRPSFSEGRLDVLAGLPQTIGRPRQRTPGCICSDTDFLNRYAKKWNKAVG